jgi:threonine/homoserine/homoserine lactone efflux protein
MALILRNAIVDRGGGIATALGVCAGQMVWVAASSAGVAALLVASEPIFDVVKLAGAAYLVFIGAQALLAAFRPKQSMVPESEPARRSVASWVAFRQGLISNLGNPKMAVFYTSLLPQFAPSGGASIIVLLFLGAAFCLMAMIWLVGYAAVIARAGEFLRRPRARRIIEGLTGTALVALGLRVATGHR